MHALAGGMTYFAGILAATREPRFVTMPAVFVLSFLIYDS